MKGNRNKVIDAIKGMVDYLQGERHVDNAANPASAHSMTQRKIKNTLPRPEQEKQLEQKKK